MGCGGATRTHRHGFAGVPAPVGGFPTPGSPPSVWQVALIKKSCGLSTCSRIHLYKYMGEENSHLKSAFLEKRNQNISNIQVSDICWKKSHVTNWRREYCFVRYLLEKISCYKLNEESTFPKHVKIDLSVQISHFKTEHCWLRKSLEFRWHKTNVT